MFLIYNTKIVDTKRNSRRNVTTIHLATIFGNHLLIAFGDLKVNVPWLTRANEF